MPTNALYSDHVVSHSASGDPGPRVEDGLIVATFTLPVFFIAAVSAAIGGASWVLTFTSWTQFMFPAYFVPFLCLAILLSGWSMFVLRSAPGQKRGRRLVDMLKRVPRGWLIAFGILAIAVWITTLGAIFSLPGQPEREPGSQRYAYDAHGVLIPVTRAEYLHAVAVQNRLFLGIALVFAMGTALISWQERNRRRRDLATPSTRTRLSPTAGAHRNRSDREGRWLNSQARVTLNAAVHQGAHGGFGWRCGRSERTTRRTAEREPAGAAICRQRPARHLRGEPRIHREPSGIPA
jgi:hypothetical protein